MPKYLILTNKAPQAIGPYSQGIATEELVFISGQLGLDPETGDLKNALEEQILQAFQNLKMILNKAGSSLENVVKTTIFLKDMNDFSTVNEVYGKFFIEPFPARSVIQVCQLPKQGLIEIEAIALRNC